MTVFYGKRRALVLSVGAALLPASWSFTSTGYQQPRLIPRRASSPSRYSRLSRHHGSPLLAVATTSQENALDQALDQADLRLATRLLKENPETELSRSRWQAIFDAIEEQTANAEENTENLRQAAEFPMQSEARTAMTQMYSTLQQAGHLRLYGAVDTKQPLAAGSHDLPSPLLESILDMPMKSLTPRPDNSLLYAGIAFALLEGVLSLALGISLNLLTFATLAAFATDRLFLNGAIFESFFKFFSPGVQQKILKHEAGHFLAAYLLGCPVEGIVLSAWAALQDRRFGARQVSAGTSFFDPDLSVQINSQGQVKRSALDRYSIIVMAGIAAEAEQYGQADGGAGDEMALVSFLSRLNPASNRPPQWTSETIRNQARWGALQAVLMFREYKPAYDALVDALERGGTLGDCVYAIEKAAREHNLKPLQEPLGYLEDGGKWTKGALPSSGPELAAVSTAPPTSTLPNTAFDEEATLASLSQYRSEVEKRLQDVERKLKELDNGEQ